ncbi:hypothetical protein Aph01nite_38580 [Acrocarpospora phusangensis]|uniref:Uncharacterized protein n=1 Tax=Acrocarpospora phusangensis TaxID=1070424 RepID=A0A919UPN4_9ACTN|nr:hypothetical protein [Acrocarpospora phusangensis]GIH25548.1 hypothetical protein Aph01nite_38580 [Acrocarpospora phusangensis]
MPPLPAWPASAAAEADAEPVREPVRTGEPGDVPVWPPRLPGEAAHAEDGMGDDPPVVPRHWPTAETERAGRTLRPWSAPGRVPATVAESQAESIPEPQTLETPLWPSSVGAHATSEAEVADLPEAAAAAPAEAGAPAASDSEPAGAQWPAFGSWPSAPVIGSQAQGVPAEEETAAQLPETLPETSAGVPAWSQEQDGRDEQDHLGGQDYRDGQGGPEDRGGPDSADGPDARGGPDRLSGREASDHEASDEAEAAEDDRDQVTVPGEREGGLNWPEERKSNLNMPGERESGLNWPGERESNLNMPGEPAEWPPGPGRWRSVEPLPPLPEETVAETTIPRRDVLYPIKDASPGPLRRLHGENTPAEGIVLPPVPQQQAYRQPPPPARIEQPPARVEEPPASGGAGRKVVLAICSVIVVGAMGAAAYFAYTDAGDPLAASSAPAAAEPSAVPEEGPDPAPVTAAVLDSEATDPRKLTLAEAFPDSRISVEGRTFRRVKVNITDKCEDAAAGAFAEALAQHQCRRVLRATYVDSRKQYAITTGIAVLPTKEAALEVDKTKNLGGNLWFRGLDGEPESGAERVSISGGYAAGMVWGRYIVFSYATYADGHTPVEKEKDLGPVSGAFRDHTAAIIEKRITS